MLASAALAGCTTGDMGTGLPGVSSIVPSSRPDVQTASAADDGKHGKLDRLISRYSVAYEVPETLVRRVIRRESNYNPKAYHAGNYGLMQIRYGTAKGMGYDGGPHGLLDAETNLKYAVKYLKGAWLVAGRDEPRADRLYQTGYYYTAKQKGMLDRVGWNGSSLEAKAEEPAAAQDATVAAVQPAATSAQSASIAAPTTVASAAGPDVARFAPAVAAQSGQGSTRAATTVAMGYSGSVPAAAPMPAIMRAPPERPAR